MQCARVAWKRSFIKLVSLWNTTLNWISSVANHYTGLDEIRKHHPVSLSFLRNMYLDSSKGWYYGMSDSIREVDCNNGFHQGDVAATWAYVMTIHPLLMHIQSELKNRFANELHLVKFYVDDGNFVAPFHVMQVIVQLLNDPEVVNKYGYRLRKNKGPSIITTTTTTFLMVVMVHFEIFFGMYRVLGQGQTKCDRQYGSRGCERL